jgi:cation diffusion facilitator CzcD-associated flavoprotein CzcO
MTELPPTTVGIIGAGVSGMAAGLRMQRAGVPFTIFEKGDEVGGTWRENRYPGLTIDVPSPIYTFEGQRNPHWRRFMPDQPEILDYHRDVSIRTGLREQIRFGAEVVTADWNGTEWDVRLADGERHRFRVLVCASGFLHHPRFPEIDGLDSFAGETVHSAQWRDEIVVAGRRVGVIGSGSTGVQLVTALGGFASGVVHFQRTPQWIFPGPNFTIPMAVRRLLERVPRLSEGFVTGTELFADWLVGGAAMHPGWKRGLVERVARWHLMTVRDPELRRKLTPPDSALCKRPVLSNGFYRTVQRPDVEVVVDRIGSVEPAGVRTIGGALHELDLLIFATGFQAHNYMRPIAITGEDGLALDEVWANGPYGYRTMSIPGFPNLFMVMGPHSPLVSFPIHLSAELQSEYIARMVEVLDGDGVVAVAPTQAATDRWLAEIRAGMPGTIWQSGCTSWYLGAGDTPVLWPYDRRRWREVLRHPQLADYEVKTTVPEPAEEVAAAS